MSMTREEAQISLAKLKRYMSGGGVVDKKANEALDMAIKALEQPGWQKGEWIDYTEDGYVECPFCHSATNCDGNKEELHFCFSCGADMRGIEND